MYVYLKKVLCGASLCVLSCSDVSAASVDCREWIQLTDNQKKIAEWLYDRGKPHNMSYTLVAISYTESTLGKYRLNIKSGDVGVMQINYKSGNNILGITNYYKQAELHQRLIYDDELNVTLALNVLDHFNKVHNGNWKKMIMSYNIGNRKDAVAKKRGQLYYSKVAKTVKLIKQCSGFK